MFLPLLEGAPSGHRQHASRPGMRKLAAVAACGMHGWLQRHRGENEGAAGARSNNRSPANAVGAAPRGTAGGDKQPVPRGQLGEASPAVSKRAKRGKGSEEPHAGAEEVGRETTTPAPQHSGGSMPPPPPRNGTGERGFSGICKRLVPRGQPGEASPAVVKRIRRGEGERERP